MNEEKLDLEGALKQAHEPQFQVGDIVEAFGVRGTVHSVFGEDGGLRVAVKFDVDLGYVPTFSRDGLFRDWHKTPSLKLISRAKKKVKKFGYLAIVRTSQKNKYVTDILYDSYEDAKNNFKDRFVALGPKIEWTEEE